MDATAVQRVIDALKPQPGNEGVALMLALATDALRRDAAIAALGAEMLRLQLIGRLVEAGDRTEAAAERRTFGLEISRALIASEKSTAAVDAALEAFLAHVRAEAEAA